MNIQYTDKNTSPTTHVPCTSALNHPTLFLYGFMANLLWFLNNFQQLRLYSFTLPYDAKHIVSTFNEHEL